MAREVFTLTPDMVRSELVEEFSSFIWTERFAEIGDFRLTMRSTQGNRKRFAAGTLLTHSETFRVGRVENTDDVVDKEGRKTFTVTGRLLESIFDSRLAREDFTDLTTDPKWILNLWPADIARQIVDVSMIDGTLDAGDILPLFHESPGWIYPEDTIPEPPDTVVYEVAPQTVYQAVKTICDIYNMGFRLYREYEFGAPLTFGIYMGVDRTTQQTDFPAVVFSPALDNMQNTTEFSTVADYKNVAYVLSPVGCEIVYGLDVDPTISSWDRKVLVVVAEDIQDVVPADATDRMIQRGLEELAKHRQFSGFDGEINQDSGYQYGGSPSIDGLDPAAKVYNLGDLVELQSDSGSTSIMQVTEQIFVTDAQGDRAYPTLTTKSLVVDGAWDSAPPDLVWDDIDPLSTWDSGDL